MSKETRSDSAHGSMQNEGKQQPGLRAWLRTSQNLVERAVSEEGA